MTITSRKGIKEQTRVGEEDERLGIVQTTKIWPYF